MPTPTSQSTALLLSAALERVRRVSGLPVAFGGEMAAAPSHVVLEHVLGGRTNAIRGLRIGVGRGLGGRVIASGQPHFVNDYLSDPLISHEFDRPVALEELRSIVAAPVRVGRTVRAVIYGGVRDGQSIGARGVESIARIAKDLEFELTVRAEVENRLTRIETHELLAEFRINASGAARRRIAEAHLDLHDLSQATADQHLRKRIAEIADRLVALERREDRSVRLSPREVDVVSLAAVGYGNAEIAERLGIGAETVKGYLRNVARKLGTHTRSGAVATARRAGYVV